METLTASAIALVLITVFVGLYWLGNLRSKTILHKWAAENGFQLVSFDQKYMIGTGPFKWGTNGRGQTVYFIRVRDREGKERSGWIRCGSYLGGVWFSKQTEVSWEGP